jgi:hypothetical protein
MTRVRLTGVFLSLLLALACGDDTDKPNDGSATDGLSDGGGGDLHPNLKIKSLTPETATLILNQLQDIKVELNTPPTQKVYVDVISKDPTTITVVHATLTFPEFDTEEMTTVQALKLTNGAEAEVTFTIRGTGETATFKAKVQKVLPDFGVTDM